MIVIKEKVNKGGLVFKKMIIMRIIESKQSIMRIIKSKQSKDEREHGGGGSYEILGLHEVRELLQCTYYNKQIGNIGEGG